MRPFEAAAVAAGAAYLLVLGWAMQSLSYDIWGALVVVPVLSLISAPLIMRAFTSDLAVLRPWAWAGMFVKFAGAVVGYSVRFDAYEGSADASRYHAVGKQLAGAVREGSGILARGASEQHRHPIDRAVHRARLHRVRFQPDGRVHGVHLAQFLGSHVLREGRPPRCPRPRHAPLTCCG